MKFQDLSILVRDNKRRDEQTDKQTTRMQYVPSFFEVVDMFDDYRLPFLSMSTPGPNVIKKIMLNSAEHAHR